MNSKLLSFIQILRSQDVRISPAETLDAMDIASVLGFSNRSVLHDGLSMALAKTPQEKAAFSQCFERFFTHKLLDFSSDDEEIAASIEPSGGAEFSPADTHASPEAILQSAAESDAQLQALLDTPLMQKLMQNNRNELSLALNQAG